MAAAVALLFVALPVAWYSGPFPPHPSPQLFAAYGAALFLSTLFASVLAIWRARLAGDVAATRIAAACVYAVPLVTLYVVGSPIGGWRRDAAAWAFSAWEIGWALMLVWYASSPQRRANVWLTLCLSLLVSFAIAALARFELIPNLFVPGSETFANLHVTVYWLSIGFMAAAFAALVRRRPFTSLDAWLCVGLVLLVAGTTIAAQGGSLASVMTPAGRLAILLSSIVVVSAMLSEFARMLQRNSAMERFVAMAEAAGTIVYFLDENGVVTYMNRRWTEVTGQPLSEALGEGWRKMLHPDDSRRNAPVRQESMSTRKPYRVEQRYRQADGSYRWFIDSATAVRDVDGKLQWYGTVTDIDAEHRAREEVAALYEREQRVSKMLQTAFLPSFLLQVEGVGLQGVYRPALYEAEVGGDWYDAFTLRDGRLAISIGDVFGHGIEAATAMVRLRETFRAVTAFTDANPSIVLKTADEVFTTSHPDSIASALFGIFDPASRVLQFSCAGHPPPVLLRKDHAQLFRNGGAPLGVDSESRFSVETIILEARDVVAFYTDGLTEVDRNVIEGEKRLMELMRRHSDDAERLVGEMLHGKQRDDVALLLLSIVDTSVRPSWHFKSDDAASAEDARSAFTAHLRRRNVDPQLVTTAELVFGELVGNVVRHAPGPIEVELLWRADRPVISVRDRGPLFEIGEIALPTDDFLDHGRGLFIVSQFASRPVVNPRTGGGKEVLVELSPAPGVRSSENLAHV